MPNRKISDLTELTSTPAADDLIQVVDVSDTTYGSTGTNKQIQYSNLVPATSQYLAMIHGSFFDNALRDVYLPFTGESEMTTIQRWNKLPMGYDGYLKQVVIRREYTTPTSGDLALTLYRYPRNTNTPTSMERVVVTPTYASITQVVFTFTAAAVLAPTYSYSLYLENNLDAAMGNTSFTAFFELTQ